MAHETGTANSPADLLNKLATFASAQGWSTKTLTDGTGFTSPDGATFAVAAATDSLSYYGCVGLDGSKAAAAQPNASTWFAQNNAMAGPFAGYSFFAGSESGAYYLHGVIEISAGIFRPFALGRLVKLDSTAGGEYVSAVYWVTQSPYIINYPDNQYHEYLFDSSHIQGYQSANNYSHVRADLDGKTNNWMAIQQPWADNVAIGSARTNGLLSSLIKIGYQRYNKLAPLLPIYVFGARPSNEYSPLGYVPDLRIVDLTLLTPKQIVTIGGEDWQVFPACQRTDTVNVGPSSIPSSGYYGYAFKVVP